MQLTLVMTLDPDLVRAQVLASCSPTRSQLQPPCLVLTCSFLQRNSQTRNSQRSHKLERGYKRGCLRERSHERRASVNPPLTRQQQFEGSFASNFQQSVLDYVKAGVANGGFNVEAYIAETRTRIAVDEAAAEVAAAATASAAAAAAAKGFVPCFWHSYHNTDFYITGKYAQHEEATCNVLPLKGALETAFFREQFTDVEAQYWKKMNAAQGEVVTRSCCWMKRKACLRLSNKKKKHGN